MKTLISANTVRQAIAQGQTSLPAGKQVIVTPEARELAGKLGLRLEPEEAAPATPAAPVSATPAMPAPQADTAKAAKDLHAAVLARLPPEVASKPELVQQIVRKVEALKNAPPACPQATSASVATPRSAAAPRGIRLVKGDDIHLGVFPGAGTEKQVGIADVITAADGAPMAAGFMAWSKSFFPWTLDYDEIDLVLEGELHIRCGGQTLQGRAGDVFYIPKGSAIEFGTPSAVRFFYVTYPANWQD